MADANNLPFKNNCFDVILSLFLLHHIVNIENTLHEIYRVLKPEGHLYAVEPSAWNIVSQLYVRKNYIGSILQKILYGSSFASPIERPLNPNTIKIMAKAANFRNVRYFTITVIPSIITKKSSFLKKANDIFERVSFICHNFILDAKR